MRFLREAVVIYRFLSAIKALITVISHSLLANAVLMAPLGREGDRSVPLAAGLQLLPRRVSDTLGFGAARWVTGRQAAVLRPGRTPREASIASQQGLRWGPLLRRGPGHPCSAVRVDALAPEGAAGRVAAGAVPAVLGGTHVPVPTPSAQSWVRSLAGRRGTLGAGWD